MHPRVSSPQCHIEMLIVIFNMDFITLGLEKKTIDFICNFINTHHLKFSNMHRCVIVLCVSPTMEHKN